jgi:hypothetical protein
MMNRPQRPTEASLQIRSLAAGVARTYVARLAPRAVLLTGSAAEGISDHWSDIDLVVHHDELPPEAAIAEARLAAGGGELLVISPWDGRSFVESFPLRGVECQVAHGTVAGAERGMAEVLVDLDVTSLHQKVMDGLLHSLPLHGEDLLRRWQDRLADYPDELRRAMVERHLRFAPLWLGDGRMATRDATLWRHQMLVEASLNLLAVLAGLNRVYFSGFQFKRLHAFADRLASRPDDLAGRLDRLFEEPATAGAGLEALVRETIALVERDLPDVDTAPARRWLGRRPAPWNLDTLSPSSPGSPAAPGRPAP